MNNAKTPLPSNIEGVCGTDNIAELWHKHYCDLFNSVKSENVVVEDVKMADGLVVRTCELYNAILKLGDNKACGLDGVMAEHLKFSSNRICPCWPCVSLGF